VHVFLHINTRLLSVSETAIALRPFLFSVHPDLFGKFPKEQVKVTDIGLQVDSKSHQQFLLFFSY